MYIHTIHDKMFCNTRKDNRYMYMYILYMQLMNQDNEITFAVLAHLPSMLSSLVNIQA